MAPAGQWSAQMLHLMHLPVSTTGTGRLAEPTMRWNVAAMGTEEPPR